MNFFVFIHLTLFSRARWMNTKTPLPTAPAVPDKSAYLPPVKGRVVFIRTVVDYSTTWDQVIRPPGFDEPDDFVQRFAYLHPKDVGRAEIDFVLLDLNKTGSLAAATKWATSVGLEKTIAREVSAIGCIESKDLPHQLKEDRLFVANTTTCERRADVERLCTLSLTDKGKVVEMFRADKYGNLPNSWFVFRIPPKK